MANNFWDWFRGSASLGGAGWLQNAAATKADGYNKRFSTKDSWLQKLLSLGQYYETEKPSNEALGKWFKDTYGSNFGSDSNASRYLSSMSDADLGALIENNYYKNSEDGIPEWLGGSVSELDIENLLKDVNNLENVQTGPRLEDYLGDYYGDAERQINAENEDILKMYDDNLARQTNNFNNELDNLNNNYNDYARQVLSNDYQKNAAILGTYQSEMSRARQNSLESGANAGLRIAGNINTLLSAQNKQASTSLETSNQLAQAMINQRNAAASLRGQYNSMLNEDTANRANLRRGTYERTQNAANLNYNNRMNQYNVANQITTENNGNYTSSPLYDSYIKQGKANKW